MSGGGGSHQVEPFCTEHGALEIDGHRDRALGSRDLDGEVGVVGHHHELHEGGAPKDPVIQEVKLGDVEDDALRSIILSSPKGDHQRHLSERHCESRGYAVEWLCWL